MPGDISCVIKEIDDILKKKGLRPIGRPLAAVVEFGKRFGRPMPFADPGSKNPELAESWKYSKEIFDWYERVYGDLMKIDPFDHAKVAVRADDDLWALGLPIMFGEIHIVCKRELSSGGTHFSSGPITINPCELLIGITQDRLEMLTDDDLNQVLEMFLLGLDVRRAFNFYQNASHYFREAESDWATAVFHLTGQNPNFGQSRWASLQLAEKFMKGLIVEQVSPDAVKFSHNLTTLLKKLPLETQQLDRLQVLLPTIQCTAEVRYGEIASTLHEAYLAHRNSLLLVRALGPERPER